VNNQTAFGGMLHHLVELSSIVLRPEPLDQKSSGTVSKCGKHLSLAKSKITCQQRFVEMILRA